MSLLAMEIADRIAERLVGIRRPYVSTTSVSMDADGRARVVVVTPDGTVTFVEDSGEVQL
jgi:hypothetical protein